MQGLLRRSCRDRDEILQGSSVAWRHRAQHPLRLCHSLHWRRRCWPTHTRHTGARRWVLLHGRGNLMGLLLCELLCGLRSAELGNDLLKHGLELLAFCVIIQPQAPDHLAGVLSLVEDVIWLAIERPVLVHDVDEIVRRALVLDHKLVSWSDPSSQKINRALDVCLPPTRACILLMKQIDHNEFGAKDDLFDVRILLLQGLQQPSVARRLDASRVHRCYQWRSKPPLQKVVKEQATS
mmetsp:Transcript_79705/g.178584  ORF Transcript_79705/g.178584 Transcript_79705/m.178584 type:complete len:237 (-) Transcript_79705:36-746(-)